MGLYYSGRRALEEEEDEEGPIHQTNDENNVVGLFREVQRGIDVRGGILFLSTPSGFIHRGRCGVADPRCEPVLRLVRIQRRQGIERGISVHLPGRMARNLRRWTGEGV